MTVPRTQLPIAFGIEVARTVGRAIPEWNAQLDEVVSENWLCGEAYA
jgi:hypothetical protein